MRKQRRNKIKIESNTARIENVFNTHYNRNALVSMVTTPYSSVVSFFFHTIIREVETICELLSELQYNVDLVNYDQECLPDGKKYELLLGYGESIEKYLFQHPKRDFKLILYRNGSDSSFSDKVSMERLENFYTKHGIIPFESAPVYQLTHRAQVWFADSIIALGNDFVRNTFLNHTSARVDSVDLFYQKVNSIDLETKDFRESQNRFVWFGSRGAIRKGLDLVLDVFIDREDIELYVCGMNKEEARFYSIYKEAFSRPNIHDLGFVKMESEEFTSLLMNTGAIIFPTIWEGGGGAVLNLVGNGGIVPIISENLGLDFDNEEFLIKDFTKLDIEIAIDTYLRLSESQLKKKSICLKEYISTRHAYENYREALRQVFVNTENP